MTRHLCLKMQLVARWSKLAGAGVILSLLVTTLALAHYMVFYSEQVQRQIFAITKEVDLLKQEQAMPALVLNRYRNSICYIIGIYDVAFPHQRPIKRTRISGTGFLVAADLVATNRHVAEPWYKDPDSDALVAEGARPTLEKLLAYFPDSPAPVNLIPTEVSPDTDLALLRMKTKPEVSVEPLPLSSEKPKAGELVAVVGYPMGVLGMVAKAPSSVYARLTQQAHPADDQGTATELATLSLIRPSATCGHLGDVVGDRLIYDAPTAHGASGGPVFNSHGEVLGINTAFIDGFAGGGLGIVSEALKPLILEAQRKSNRRVGSPAPAR